MKRLVVLMAAFASLAACAHTTPPPTGAVAAESLVPALRIDPPPAPDLRLDPPRKKSAVRRPLSATEALAAANRAARQGPARAAFEDATLYYAYQPGALYELSAAPAFISTILLEPGETLLDVAAGDTARWMVSNTVAGDGEAQRTLVMVKPQEPGLKTNIVLVTTRRAYLIEANSSRGETYTAQIAWRYPAPLRAPTTDRRPDAPRLVNDAYRIKPPRGMAPAWTPRRVFDDGFKTTIEFPADIAASDMPPLFVRTGEGAELVNYRVQGDRYIVDRLFDVAELRLGRADPVIVRIERRRALRQPGDGR